MPAEPHPRCGATRHGTANDYAKRGCRCPAASLAYSIRRHQRNTGALPPGHIPALGTRRRLQALYAAGHDAVTIAAATGLTPVTIRVLLGPEGSTRPERRDRALAPTVQRTTADTITAATIRLARLPGRQPKARARAQRAGWPPLHVWDGHIFNIDDPHADPALAAATCGRCWLRLRRPSRLGLRRGPGRVGRG